jgi:hypothetical protein
MSCVAVAEKYSRQLRTQYKRDFSISLQEKKTHTQTNIFEITKHAIYLGKAISEYDSSLLNRTNFTQV